MAGAFSKPYYTCEASETRSGHLTHLPETILKLGSFDTRERCPGRNRFLGEALLPNNANDTLNLRLLEPFSSFDVPTIQSPDFASVEKAGQNTKDNVFSFYIKAVIADSVAYAI